MIDIHGPAITSLLALHRRFYRMLRPGSAITGWHSGSDASSWAGGGADMAEEKRVRVAIGGFGAIGKVVARRLDRGIEGLALAAVAARDTARAEAEAAMADFTRVVPVVALARLS